MISTKAKSALRKVAVDWDAVGRHAAFGAGGAGTGLLTNYLLGNDSLTSYLLSGGIGAGGGLLLDAILNSGKGKKSGGKKESKVKVTDPMSYDLTALGAAGGVTTDIVRHQREKSKAGKAAEAENARLEQAAKDVVEQKKLDYDTKKGIYDQAWADYDAQVQAENARFDKATKNYKKNIAKQKKVIDAIWNQFNTDKQAQLDIYQKAMEKFKAACEQNKILREDWEARRDYAKAHGKKPPEIPNWVETGQKPDKPKFPREPDELKNLTKHKEPERKIINKPTVVKPTPLTEADLKVEFTPVTAEKFMPVRGTLRNFGRNAWPILLMSLLGYGADKARNMYQNRGL